LAFDGLKGPDAQLVPGNDLVSYNEKHNEANGEYNRDGHSNNLSWNHGVDGPSDDQAVKALRFQQTRNLLATLLLSRGTRMILAGDEVARTRTGNNMPMPKTTRSAGSIGKEWTLVGGICSALPKSSIEIRQRQPLFRATGF
jgi:glycogen operon protein